MQGGGAGQEIERLCCTGELDEIGEWECGRGGVGAGKAGGGDWSRCEEVYRGAAESKSIAALYHVLIVDEVYVSHQRRPGRRPTSCHGYDPSSRPTDDLLHGFNASPLVLLHSTHPSRPSTHPSRYSSSDSKIDILTHHLRPLPYPNKMPAEAKAKDLSKQGAPIHAGDAVSTPFRGGKHAGTVEKIVRSEREAEQEEEEERGGVKNLPKVSLDESNHSLGRVGEVKRVGKGKGREGKGKEGRGAKREIRKGEDRKG